jgi:flagellar protein FliO/FliZ
MFVLVLGMCYFTTVWISNFQKGKFGKGNIEVIDVHRVTNNKYIEIVRIGKKYYALSVSKDHIEKLDVIDEADIELPKETPVRVGENFNEILEKIKKLKHTQDKE